MTIFQTRLIAHYICIMGKCNSKKAIEENDYICKNVIPVTTRSFISPRIKDNTPYIRHIGIAS